MLLSPVLLIVAVAVAFRSLLAGVLVGAGALLLFALAMVFPLSRPLRVAQGQVRLPDTVVHGVQFPVRLPRAAVVAWSFFAVIFTVLAIGLAAMAFAKREFSSLIGTLVLGGFATVFILAVVSYLRRDRTNPPSVTIAESGIVVVGNAARFIGWDAVAGIKAEVQTLMSGWWSIRQNAITIEVQGAGNPKRGRLRLFANVVVGNDNEAVRNVLMDSDPVVTYHALRYYWRNPDAREELGSEAAVERVRKGRF